MSATGSPGLGTACLLRWGHPQPPASAPDTAGWARRARCIDVKTIYMRWSRDNRDGPRGYHHGNLKEALIRAALELIAQKGPAGFTFAEAARWAGVSPAAPYRPYCAPGA